MTRNLPRAVGSEGREGSTMPKREELGARSSQHKTLWFKAADSVSFIATCGLLFQQDFNRGTFFFSSLETWGNFFAVWRFFCCPAVPPALAMYLHQAARDWTGALLETPIVFTVNQPTRKIRSLVTLTDLKLVCHNYMLTWLFLWGCGFFVCCFFTIKLILTQQRIDCVRTQKKLMQEGPSCCKPFSC